MEIRTHQKVKTAEIQAVLIRADGSRENLGTIAYWHRSVLKRFIWALKQWLKHGRIG